MYKRSIVIALAALICGCAQVKPKTVWTPPDRATTLIEKSMLEEARMPIHSNSADVSATPAVMTGDRITIRSYVGDAKNLLTRLAKSRGITFRITGPEPYLPLLVTIDVESITFDDLLEQIGYQFGQRADLVVGDARIEIRYRGQP